MASDQAARIGARLRARREELELTRAQLARVLDGVATEHDIYRWETGRHRPQDDTLASLAKALGKDFAWAMGMSEEVPADDSESDLSPALPATDVSEQISRLEAKMDQRMDAIEAIFEALVKRMERERPRAHAAPEPLERQTAEDAVQYLNEATRVMTEVLGRLGRDVGRRDVEQRRDRGHRPESDPAAA